MSKIPDKPWTFQEWFIAQHGPRPDKIDLGLLRDRIESQHAILANDRILLRRLENWELSRTSALYAWNLKDGDKRA